MFDFRVLHDWEKQRRQRQRESGPMQGFRTGRIILSDVAHKSLVLFESPKASIVS